MLQHVPLDTGIDPAVPEFQPVPLSKITWEKKDGIFFKRSLQTWNKEYRDGNKHWYSADETLVEWDDAHVSVDGKIMADIGDCPSYPKEGRWVVNTDGTLGEFPLDPTASYQKPVHGSGEAISFNTYHQGQFRGYAVSGGSQYSDYFYKETASGEWTLYIINQGNNSNLQLSYTPGGQASYSSNYVSYATIANGLLCLTYYVGNSLAAGTVTYEELSISTSMIMNSISILTAATIYQRVWGPGNDMIITSGTGARVYYINGFGTSSTALIQMTTGAGSQPKWKTSYWNSWRKDQRMYYVNGNIGGALSYDYCPVTPVMGDYFCLTGPGWTLAEKNGRQLRVDHYQTPFIKSANSYISTLGNTVIGDNVLPWRALNLSFISPNILTIPTTGDVTNIANFGFSNNSALELNPDQSSGGIYPVISFTVLGTPNLTNLGPGNGGLQVGDALGDFYCSLNEGSLIYQWSTADGGTPYRNPLLIDTTYYNTTDPIISIPINSKFGKTRTNDVIANWDDVGYKCISINSKSMLLSQMSGMIDRAKTIFNLMGTTYITDDVSLFQVSLSGNTVTALNFIAALDGLKFVGCSTSEAMFYSEYDHCLYSYTGDLQIHFVIELSAWGSLRDSDYHQESGSYLLLMDDELLVLRQNVLCSTGEKASIISAIEKGIVAYSDDHSCILRFDDPNKGGRFLTNYFAYDKLVWSRLNSISLRTDKIGNSDEGGDISIIINWQQQGGDQSKVHKITPTYKDKDMYTSRIPIGVAGSSFQIDISSEYPLSISDLMIDWEATGTAPNDNRALSKW